jgi:hypothetical protein
MPHHRGVRMGLATPFAACGLALALTALALTGAGSEMLGLDEVADGVPAGAPAAAGSGGGAAAGGATSSGATTVGSSSGTGGAGAAPSCVAFLGGPYEQSTRWVGVGADGKAVAVGRFLLEIDAGSGTVFGMGGWDAWAAKFDTDCSVEWMTTFGSAANDSALHGAIAPNGDIAVVGTVTDDISFTGSAADLVPTDGADGFVVRLLPDGTPSSSTAFGGVGMQRVSAARFDDAGNLLLLVSAESVITLDSTQIAVAAGDAFLLKLDPAANYLWHAQFESPGRTHVRGLDVDPSGNIYVGGRIEGDTTIRAGATTEVLTLSGDADGFVATFDADGGLQSHNHFEASMSPGNRAYVRGIDWAGGRLLAIGHFRGSTLFGTSSSTGGRDAFVMGLTPGDPAPSFVHTLGGPFEETLAAAAFAPDGSTIVVGARDGANPAPDLPATSFIATLDATGALIGERSFGNGRIVSLDFDAAGRTVVTGTYVGDFPGFATPSTGVDAYVAWLD